jgi:hypothetical protein
LSERAITYPEVHDLDALLNISAGLNLTTAEREILNNLNTYYFRKDDQRFPSRYRKPSGDIWTSPGQQGIEKIVSAILKQRKNDT